MKFSTNHPIWIWGMRHACWILNRYSPQKGMMPYELVYGKGYSGSICQFGEPVFGYVHGPNKGDARWKRIIFLGKVESQDSLLCFDGEHHSYKICAQSVNKLEESFIFLFLCFFQKRFLRIQSWTGRQNCAYQGEP